MRAADGAIAFGAIDARDNLFSPLRKTDARRVQPEGYAFLLQNLLCGGRHILVFTRDQAGALLDNRHLAAEAPVHLPEFETDVTAPDDNQPPRQEIDIHHRAVR